MEARLLSMEKADNCLRTLEIEVQESEVQTQYDKIFAEYQKKAQVPGFRSGKVPTQIIKAKFSNTIRSEAVNDVIPEAFNFIAKEQKLNLYSQPYVLEASAEPGQPIKFKVIVEVHPDFELADYKGLNLKKHKITVTEEEVDKAVATAQERAATFTPVTDRPAKEGDLVAFEYEEKIEGKEPRKNSEQFEIGKKQVPVELESAFPGKTIDSTFTVSLTYPDTIKDKTVAGKAAEYSVKLLEIKEKKLPELDDEFAKDMGNFETLQQYKDSLRKELEEYKDHEEKHHLEHQIEDILVERNPMELPGSMLQVASEDVLKRTKQNMQYYGMTEENMNTTPEKMVEQSKITAAKSLKTLYIFDEITKREKIEITDEDINQEIARLATKYNVSPEKYKEYVVQNKKINSMRDDMRHEKIIDYLISQANVELIEPEGK